MILKLLNLVKNLSSFVIVSASLVSLSGGMKYEKYISYIVGLIIAVYVMSGILELDENYKELKFSLPSTHVYDDCINQANEIYTNAYEDMIVKELKNNVSDTLINQGFVVKKLKCYYIKDEGYYIDFVTDCADNINIIKNYLIDVYQLPSEHINGYTEDKDI